MSDRAHAPNRAQTVPTGTAQTVPMRPPIYGGRRHIGFRSKNNKRSCPSLVLDRKARSRHDRACAECGGAR
jgi:hypothetical protein